MLTTSAASPGTPPSPAVCSPAAGTAVCYSTPSMVRVCVYVCVFMFMKASRELYLAVSCVMYYSIALIVVGLVMLVLFACRHPRTEQQQQRRRL